MNRLMAALMIAATGLAVAPTSASATKVVFKGAMGIESTTSACGILPYLEQTNLLKVVYMPAGLGTNGPAASVLVMKDVLVSSFLDLMISSFLTQEGLGPTYAPATAATATSGDNFSLNFTEYTARVRALRQDPRTLTEQTKLVTLRLQIQNFGNVAGCVVTLRGVLLGLLIPE